MKGHLKGNCFKKMAQIMAVLEQMHVTYTVYLYSLFPTS